MKVNPISILVFTLVVFLFSAFSFPQPEPLPNDKFVVVLDAGHGGHDPGNLGNGYLEKEIALEIVLEAGKVLEGHSDIKVVYTRKDDRFVDLYVRGEIANKAKADLFVSVHCDSHNSDANGAGTFVLGLHANKQNFEIAKKENSVIYLEDNYETRYAAYDINSPESIIGLTIMQEEFLDKSILLAKMMQDNFTKSLSRKDRKVKQAGFIVLHQTFMPSVLVETGFLTNKSEGSYLNSRKGQAEMGKAIADAIILYKNNLRASGTGFEEVGENVITAVPEVKEAAKEEVPEAVVSKEVESVPAEKTPAEAKSDQLSATETKEETPPVPLNESEKVTDPAVNKELNTAVVLESTQKDAPKEEVQPKAAGAQPLVNKQGDKKEIEQKNEAVPEEKTVPPVKEAAKETAEVKEVSNVAAEKEKPKSPEKTEKVTFKVQILASSKQIPLNSANFKGLSTLSKEPYKNLFRYMYGKTSSYKQAILLKSNADLKGYTTSFIVAYKDGVRIPVKEAIKYSSE